MTFITLKTSGCYLEYQCVFVHVLKRTYSFNGIHPKLSSCNRKQQTICYVRFSISVEMRNLYFLFLFRQRVSAECFLLSQSSTLMQIIIYLIRFSCMLYGWSQNDNASCWQRPHSAGIHALNTLSVHPTSRINYKLF